VTGAKVKGRLGDVPTFSDADVAELVPMVDAVGALERAFSDAAAGRAKNMARTRIVWDGHRMQALGAYVESGRCAVVKSWLVTEHGAQPTVILFSTEDGSVLALMEAVQLGRLRTGAASGLAARYMTPPDADVLLVVGTGRQAFSQVEGIASVRPLRKVLIAARDPERTAAFAERIGQELELDAEPVGSVAEGAGRARIISMISSAREPILAAADLPSQVHVIAAGAIAPGSREVDSSVFADAGVVVADSVEQAREESAELQTAVDEGALRWEDVVELSAVVAGTASIAPDGLTVFKSLGVGLEDAAAAELVWRKSGQTDRA
jgi:ornithine cyclodeaminase/alanine dehydrogenase-like protein (mu-crystallin family)